MKVVDEHEEVRNPSYFHKKYCLYDMASQCKDSTMLGGSLWLDPSIPKFYPVLAATSEALKKDLSFWFAPIGAGALR